MPCVFLVSFSLRLEPQAKALADSFPWKTAPGTYRPKDGVVSGLPVCGFAHGKECKGTHHPPSIYNGSGRSELLLWTVDCLREKHTQPSEGEGRLWQQWECRCLLPLHVQRYCSLTGELLSLHVYCLKENFGKNKVPSS